MINNYQSSKQIFKQQPQKYHQKILPYKSQSPTQYGQQKKGIIEQDKQIPCSSEKINLSKGINSFRDHSSFHLMTITVSQLCIQYTPQNLENQRLLRQNEIRNHNRRIVNPKFQDINKSLKLIKEKITKQQQK